MKSCIPQLENYKTYPVDGTVCKTHQFCKNSFNDKCLNHYKNVQFKEGFHVCPYGFATYVSKYNNNHTTFSSLRVKGVSKSKWLKKRIQKNENNSVFEKTQLVDLVKATENQIAVHTYSTHVVREVDLKESQVNSKKELLDDTLHELRRINKQLKRQAFFLEKELSNVDGFDLQSVQDKAKNVVSAAQLVSVRLNAYDFTLNPALTEMGPKTDMNLYKKFQKAKYCLSVFAQEQQNHIEFKGTSYSSLKAFEILEILPYVLFENALRYSPKGEKIECTFRTKDDELESIFIENLGPIIEHGELPHLTEKGFRAKSAISEGIKGTGKGLYIVKLICDFHGYGLNIEFIPRDQKTGTFRVTIKINEAPREKERVLKFY